MKFIGYLKEEYISRLGDYEIFVNPTSTELSSISKARPIEVRFFVDFEKKNLLVWNINMLHRRALASKTVKTVLDVSDEESYFEKVPKLFSGFGTILAGKIDRVGSDSLETYQLYERYYKEIDAGWTVNWFKVPLNKTILKLI